jgi:hypothetical protein
VLSSVDEDVARRCSVDEDVARRCSVDEDAARRCSVDEDMARKCSVDAFRLCNPKRRALSEYAINTFRKF